MKKWISILMTAVLAAGLLSGCGKEKGNVPEGTTNVNGEDSVTNATYLCGVWY